MKLRFRKTIFTWLIYHLYVSFLVANSVLDVHGDAIHADLQDSNNGEANNDIGFGYAQKFADLPANIAGINDKDKDGNTPLMNAVYSSTYFSIKFLIKAGADSNIVINSNGDTLLFYTATHGMYRTALELIRNGAKMDTRNRDGMTPLILSLTSRHPDLAVAMLDEGAQPNFSMDNGITALIVAAQSNYDTVLQKLIEKGANLDQRTRTGETALMFAAVSNSINIMDTLLKKGAKIDIQNDLGITALMLATSRENLAAVKLLLQFESDLGALDVSGRSAYDFALGLEDNEIASMISHAGGRTGKYYTS